VIVFVGDKPSAKNVDPNVPFVGTQSYKNLLQWIWELDISVNEVKMYNKDSLELLSLMKYLGNNKINYVVLGDEAEKHFKSLNNKIQYYKLPHPSPKNRKLNNKKYIKEELKKCKEWLGEK
jgi:uracil-DNA glycosylase